MKLALVSILLALTALAQTSRVEGVVRDGKGAPIPRVAVAIMPNSGTGRPSVIAVTTGDDGAFVLENIPPGSDYRITARRQGYVSVIYGARIFNPSGVVIRLAGGEALTDIAIEMAEQGVVAGTIRDLNGDPVVNARVEILRRGYVEGQPRLLMTSSVRANDVGEYRIGNLASGTYYVRVGANTFYPNVTDERSARSITVPAGQELGGIDVQVSRQTFRVSGKLLDADGKPAANQMVAAAPETAAADASRMPLEDILAGRQNTAPDGSFTLQGLSPGVHVIQDLRSRAYRRVVLSADMTDLVLQAAPAFEIAGMVRWEGDQVQGVRPTVVLANPLVLRGSSAAQAAEEGSFALQAITPGTMKLTVNGLPDNVYVKSVKLGDTEVTGSTLKVTGAERLEIVLSANGAGVTGKASTHGALVTLWSASGESFFAEAADFTRAFAFQRLPPGVYYVAAWEDADPGLLASRAFRAKFEGNAVKIELVEGGRQAIDAPLISARAYAAAEREMQ